MAGTAGAGAALASNLAAPGLLAQTRAPIKLGNLNSFTGAIAYAAENNLNGMNLFFDSVGWTVGGRKIEIIKEDDQFNPQVGLQKAKKLVESDKVDMIVGVQASNVALAVLNYAKQQKAFYIVSGAGTDAITWDRYPYLFRTSISAYQLSTPMANCRVGARYWISPSVVSGIRIAAAPKSISGTAVKTPPSASSAAWPAPSLVNVPFPLAPSTSR